MLPYLCLALALLQSACVAVAERTILVRCESTAGAWEAEVHPSWSPNGAVRYLVRLDYPSGCSHASCSSSHTSS